MTWGAPPGEGPWVPSAGAPPGAPAAYRDRRLETIGLVCIILAASQLAWFVYTVVSSAIGMLAVDLGSSWLSSSAPGPLPPELKELMDATRTLMRTTAIWTLVRSLPFAALSGVLIHIGLGLRAGKRDSLLAAKRWMWWAFGALFVSALIQALITVPAALEYQRLMTEKLHAFSGTGAPPPAMSGPMDGWNTAWSVMGPVAGLVIMAVWPVALRLWADRLLQEIDAG